MDKRTEPLQRVQTRIVRALLRLMEDRPFSEITVTDIIRAAGVARASYYRNFVSKEDVLLKTADGIFQTYLEKVNALGKSCFGYDSVLLAFRYFKTYKRSLLCVYNAGLSSVYLQLLDAYMEELAGDMPCRDISRYQLYFFSGALYNVFIKWLENGMRERPQEMAAFFCRMLSGELAEEVPSGARRPS